MRRKRRSSNVVGESFVLLLEFSLDMIVPIVLCTLAGVWLGKKFDIMWLTVVFFFVGAIAGGQNIYKTSKKMMRDMDKSDKNDRDIQLEEFKKRNSKIDKELQNKEK